MKKLLFSSFLLFLCKLSFAGIININQTNGSLLELNENQATKTKYCSRETGLENKCRTFYFFNQVKDYPIVIFEVFEKEVENKTVITKVIYLINKSMKCAVFFEKDSANSNFSFQQNLVKETNLNLTVEANGSELVIKSFNWEIVGEESISGFADITINDRFFAWSDESLKKAYYRVD